MSHLITQSRTLLLRTSAPQRALRWATLAIAVSNPLLCAAAPASASVMDQVRIVLKFVKAKATSPEVTFDAESCTPCRRLQDKAYDRDNGRETLIGLSVPLGRTLALHFHAAAGSVRRVVMESGDVVFRAEGKQLTVELPPTGSDAVTAGEMATQIVEPGMVLRFEHADPVRRAGDYADAATFPTLQRRAADHLEFAEREVIRATGLGNYVAREKLGTMEVMGFDTNEPHGHVDAPPHIHMHLRWPHYAGTQIAHYYIDAAGLLQRNDVGIQSLHAPERSFGRAASFTTVDFLGRGVYTHTITAEGWLTLGRAGAAPCLIKPVGTGFDSGAIVDCPQRPPVTINVTDDQRRGVLQVQSGEVVETFRYDTDTGKLLSATTPPPPSESNYPRADW